MYKIIRATQRKEELEIEGDKLNRKLKLKKKEHFALYICLIIADLISNSTFEYFLYFGWIFQ